MSHIDPDEVQGMEDPSLDELQRPFDKLRDREPGLSKPVASGTSSMVSTLRQAQGRPSSTVDARRYLRDRRLVLAVVVASAIGLAGGATLAAWSQSHQLPGSQFITAGDLQLEEVSTAWTWRNVSPDLTEELPIDDPADWLATPGDVLLGYWQVDATSVGDNIAGVVTLTPRNFPATSWPAGVTATYRVSQLTTHTAAQVLDPDALGFSTEPAVFPDGPLTISVDQAGTEPVVIYLVVAYDDEAAVPSVAPDPSDWRFTVDFEQERP